MDDNPSSNPFDEEQELQSSTDADISIQPLDETEDNSRRSLIWGLIGIIAVGCGILLVGAFIFFQPNARSLMDQYFPSPTITPFLEATATPTPTPNLTATTAMLFSTAVSAQNEWPLNLKESFDSNAADWYVGKDDNQYDKITYAVQNGKYHWDITAHKGFIQWIRFSEKPFTDFYASADAQETGKPTIGEFGIVFREDQHSNYYYFAITHDGRFYVALYYKEGWKDLITPAYSPFIQPDELNKLTVWGKGSHFIFLINGHYVGEVTDNHIEAGRIGIAVGLYNSVAQSAFEFDNLELRSPAPPATSTPIPNLTATQQSFVNSTNTAQVFQTTATAVTGKWKVVLADKFDSSDKNWKATSNETFEAFFKVLDGKYSWDITPYRSAAMSQAMASTRPLKDFVLNVDARQISGSSRAEYGVLFREFSDFHGYYFGINNDGEYTLQLHEQDWIKLIDYTKSELIRPGEVNRITVVAEGSHFIFFINGQYLTEFTDQRIDKGQVSLMSILYETYKQAIFEFDNFELRAH